MKRLSKIALNIATAALVSTSVVVPAQQAQAALSSNVGPCTPIHIITVNGTGASSDKASSNVGLDLQSRFVNELSKKHPGQVSSYLVPYPAAAGAVYSINPLTDSATTYGESRLRGDAKSLEHIEAYAEKCPNSAFLMYGYSQGASVAGDVTALLANGALKNVSKDKILGAVLIADPGNSGASKYRGPSKPSDYYIPHPPNSVYNRNGEVIHTRNDKNTVGWTGQRSLGFDGIEGRVVSICSDGDLACSAPAGNSVQREVADISDKNIHPNWGYTYGITLLQTFLSSPVESLKLFGGNIKNLRGLFENSIQTVIDNGKAKLEESSFNQMQKATWVNVFDELTQINNILHSDRMYGDGVSDLRIIAHVLSKSGNAVKAFLPPQLKQYETQINQAIDWAKIISLTIPPSKLVNAGPVMDHFVNFPERHTYYFNQHKMDINGKNANDWGIEAASEGINRYIRKSPMKMSGDFSNSGEKEVAEQNRKPDGLEDMLQNGYQKYLITRETMPDDVKKKILESGGDPNKVEIPEESSGKEISSNNGKEIETKTVDNDNTKEEKTKETDVKSTNESIDMDSFFNKDDTTKDSVNDLDIYEDEKENDQHGATDNHSHVSSQSEEEMRDALLWLKEMQDEKELEEKEKKVDTDNSNVVEYSSPQSDASRSIGSNSGKPYIKSNSTLAPSANKVDNKVSNISTNKGSSSSASSSLIAKESKNNKTSNVKPVVGPSVDTGGKIDTSIFGRLRNIFK